MNIDVKDLTESGSMALGQAWAPGHGTYEATFRNDKANGEGKYIWPMDQSILEALSTTKGKAKAV